MSFARSIAGRARVRQAASFQVENLERRVLLSSAIAAFNPQQVFPTGANPLALAVADVNRDGKPDLIVANNIDGNIGVLLGNGTGSFSNQATFASGPGPIGLAIADVNGDGKPDLIVANFRYSRVSILLGNGDGTFQAPLSFPAGSVPIAVTTADVNGDGKLDILVANYGSGTVSVLDGNGDGTFQPQQTFATGAHPMSIASADLNLDGKPDIAVSNYSSSTVSVLLGTGSGNFSAPQTFAVGGKPRSVVVSDINADGKPDLVVVNKADGTASVLPGNGDGTFATQLTASVGSSPKAVAVADVNGDGKEDLVVADGGTTYPGNVAVLVGNRDGTFQPAVNFNTGANPYSVALADVNEDGRLDIATVNQQSHTASVLLGDVPPRVLSIDRTTLGPFTSDNSVSYTVAFNEPVTGVDPTDFSLVLSGSVTATRPVVVSGSGAFYTITVNGVSGAGTLGLNVVDDGSIQDAAGNPLQPGGTAAFASQQTISVGPYPGSIVTADVNGDGRADLVLINANAKSSNPVIGVLLGNGDGTFGPEQTFAAGSFPDALAVADLNGDGKPDLVVANSGSYNVSVFLGNGNGTFRQQQTFAVGMEPSSVAIGDVNGDGIPDVIVANRSGSVSALLGNGNGTFQPQKTFATGPSPEAVVVSDVNGDGKKDLVVVNVYNGTIGVLLGNGNGTFQIQRSLNANATPTSVVVADVNGDGIPDLAVSNFYPGSVGIFLGNGNGTFGPPTLFPAGSRSLGLAALDVNGDGRLDLVVTNQYPGNVEVLLGNGNGTFRAGQTIAAGTYPQSIAVADLNGDGRADIVTEDSRGGAISVLLANSSGSLDGPTYTIAPLLDTINGTAGNDSISLMLDPDGQHINWTMGSALGRLPANDPSGLTINGNGGSDAITLDYSGGNPIPDILHLNGTFAVNGLQGSDPLGGRVVEIGRSTVFISYGTADPIQSIGVYLHTGYDGGTWAGTPTPLDGAITSIAAQNNPNHSTAIGYADWADGQSVNTTPNTIELKYTLYGDVNLDGQVNSADLQALLFGLNRPGTWDQGDFNYDGQVNSADLQNLLFTLNTSLGSQATPLAVAATPAAMTPRTAPGTGSDTSSGLMPAIHATRLTTAVGDHPHPAKAAARKRR